MVQIGPIWQMTKVEDLAEYITVGFVGSMSSLFVEDGVPLLRGQNIHEYVLDLKNLKYISQATHHKWKKSALRPGDVVIVRVGYPGTACVIPDGIGDLNAASLVIVRPDRTKLDANFLCYVINSPWGKAQVAGRLVGAAQQVFNTQTAAELKIPHPPLPLQQLIAGILSAYDELIENSQQRIKILESMARTLYQEWFVHFCYPGHESVPLIPSSLGEIPQGWEVKQLTELCDRIESGGTPRRGNSEYWENGVIDWYKTGELWDGFLFGSQERITVSGQLESSARLFDEGTILMAIYGSPTVGRMGLLTRRASCNQAALGLVANNSLISQTYLYFVLYSLRDHFNSLAQGAAQQNISKEKVASALAVLPTRETIKSFDTVAEPVFAQLKTLQSQIRNLRATRDLLLPRLLSGQIDVEAAA